MLLVTRQFKYRKMAVQMRSNSWYISLGLPISTKEGREMTKFCVCVGENVDHDGLFLKFCMESLHCLDIQFMIFSLG